MLYTSLEKDGAIAEVFALLSMQPVFPSTIEFHVHQINFSIEKSLDLRHLSTLVPLGVDTGRYQDRNYNRTQEIADAAYFLGFDGLIVPNARWSCANTVLFTDKVEPVNLTLEAIATESIDWNDWRKRRRTN